MTKVLIFQGGWEGHEPGKVAELFADELRRRGATVDVADSCSALDDGAALRRYDLIMPCWTMGELTPVQTKNLLDAVHAGTGLGGSHGGMGDAFRGNTSYEWMVGGHFVGHPHVGHYTVQVTKPGTANPITAALPPSFDYDSEQYYMLIDPAVEVLAETLYTYEGKEVAMPVVWTKSWGKGRVFYSALGHVAEEFSSYPFVREVTVNGLLWAARKH
jgi:Uncharacterized protein conserved in bacteria